MSFVHPDKARLKRAAKNSAASRAQGLIRVESDVLTMEQLAARLGCTVDQARRRVYRAREKRKPLTWASIDVRDSTT